MPTARLLHVDIVRASKQRADVIYQVAFVSIEPEPRSTVPRGVRLRVAKAKVIFWANT